ncbi:type II toxin-antitoxin system VapC family toxin [Chloroflexi bacterium CFX6]|nr:type II toxin-antitoxin system VapC family toxin [Chloroflexi bacterium CFX6]
MKMLDTDHCIAILRKKLDLREHVKAEEELFISAISVAELTHGAHRSKHREDNLARLEVLFAALTILPFDESAGRRFGALKADLETRGEPLDDLDLQIASSAIENALPLATNNTNHFKRIKGLELQNWIK